MTILLIQGDARALPLADALVDGVITDEPYGLNDGAHAGERDGEFTNVAYGDWDLELDRSWIPEAVRVMKPGASFICFTDRVEITSLRDACVAAGLQARNTIYWVRQNAPKHPRQNFRSNVEAALYCVKPGAPYYWAGTQPCGFFSEVAGPATIGVRYHPNQKSIPLGRWLVKNVIRPGGLILDPLCGSGTFGIAARHEGRRAIIIDRDIEAASDRLAGRQPKLALKKVKCLEQDRLPFTEEGAA